MSDPSMTVGLVDDVADARTMVATLRGRLADYDDDLQATIAARILPDRAAYGEDVSGVTYAEISKAASLLTKQAEETACLNHPRRSPSPIGGPAMNREQLQSILDRVREATGPNRRIDAWFAVLADPSEWNWQIRENPDHIADVGVYTHSAIPPVTASVDAALAMKERCLSINSTRLVEDPSGCSCAITWWPDGLTGGTRVQSSEAQVSLSLAILAATLSALIEAQQ